MDALALQAPLRQNSPRTAPSDQASHSMEGEATACAAALSRGDRAAIEHFYRSGFPVALAVARHATRRDESFCLDVVHDAMIRVLRGVKPSLSDAQLDVYLKRCVVTSSIDRLRREKRRAARERSREVHATAQVSEPDLIASLREALNQLDDLDRSLLTARFARGATLEAAGREHGLSGPAAHGRVRRALARLGSIMKENGP